MALKYRLGLFDDPYRFLREGEIDRVVFCAEYRAHTRALGAASSVLLKNNGVLPLKPGASIALIGPFGDSADLWGCWSFSTRRNETPTIAQGLRERGFRVAVEAGCHPLEDIEGGIPRAVTLAKGADVVVLAPRGRQSSAVRRVPGKTSPSRSRIGIGTSLRGGEPPAAGDISPETARVFRRRPEAV